MNIRILFVLYKDLLLLIRDRAGLAMLFVMPLALVLIMTSIQDSTFNTLKETRIPVAILNLDKDELGNAIEKNLTASPLFTLQIFSGNEGQTVSDLRRAVVRGDYLLGLVIPENTSNTLRRNVKRDVAKAFAGSEKKITPDTAVIEVFIDPTTKASFRTTLMSNISEFSVGIQQQMLLQAISAEVKERSLIPMGDFELTGINSIKMHEQYAAADNSKIIPNSVQHNVPAWTLFAIFFIVISFAGNMIKEREDGSFTRLMTLPCPYWMYILSKTLVYLGVCLVQFLLIVAMGLWVFPLVELPALELGGQFFSMVGVTICAALAAIGYGTAIGTLSVTHQQAAIFGSISVVILAAIGGVWVPVFAMPELMQWLSHLSPLNWGIEAFYGLLLRNAGFSTIFTYCACLLLFFVATVALTLVYRKQQI